MKHFTCAILSLIFIYSCTGASANADFEPRQDVNHITLDCAFLEAAEITETSSGIILSRDFLLSRDGLIERCANEAVFIMPKAEDSVAELRVELANLQNDARSGGSKEESLADASGSMTAYTTIYYDRRSDAKGDWVKLTSISGGYTISDRQVHVESQGLEYGCNGFIPAADGAGYHEQNSSYSPSSTSWSVNTPSSWKYVSTSESTVGATLNVTLKRVGSTHTWTLEIGNNVYG